MAIGKGPDVKPPLREIVAGIQSSWNRFWFQPADPIPLGLMRILGGAIVLYVHLAYCLELTEFFGPKSWLTIEAANRERREMPLFVSSLDWSPDAPLPRLPETPARRKAVLDFMRHLPDDPKERTDRSLAFFYTLFEKTSKIDERRQFLASYAAVSDDARRRLRVAVAETAIELPLLAFLPELLRDAESTRAVLAPISEPAFGYVLDWFGDLSTPERLRAINYIKDLPRSKVERLEIFDYFEFWNADPRYTYAKGKVIFSPWFHLSDPLTIRVVHGFILVVMFLFTVGLYTRVTSVLTWLTALGYMHRSPPVLFGIDTMMSIFLFYMMIAPSGSALSVDRLRVRFRAARALSFSHGKAIPWAEAVLAGPRASAMANLGLRLFQIHFCLIYAATGLGKVRGGTWWNHVAGWLTVANPTFSLIDYRWFESFVLAVAEVRPLLGILCAGLVIFTIALEVFLPVLIWTKLRPLLVVGAIFLHSGIALSMGLTVFGLIMMTMLLSFIPAAVIRRPPAWIVRPGARLLLRYDAADPHQSRIAAVIRTLDIAGQVTFQAVEVKNATLNVVGNAKAEASPNVARAAVQSLSLLRPVAWLPGVRFVVRRVVG